MKISEFNNNIYPRLLFVVKDIDFDSLKSSFSGDEDYVFPDELDRSGRLWTIPVVRKSDMRYGVLVARCDRGKITHGDVAHEACHATDYFFEQMGLTYAGFDGNEHYAYLCGWCADKIWEGVR